MTTSTLSPATSQNRCRFAPFSGLLMASLLTACGGTDDELGTVRVTAYGEEFIEEGIAASEMDDDWEVEFDKFEVVISGVTVGGSTLDGSVTVDLAESSGGEGHELGQVEVPVGNHEGPGYTVERVEVEGSATQGDVTKTFHWVFDEPVVYSDCETTTSVSEGEAATFQITIHADHFFYDSLVSSDPELLFTALADADDDGDGEITTEELAAADVGSYDVGNEDADDLWSFLVALNATLGHVDGEGHCTAEPLAE